MSSQDRAPKSFVVVLLSFVVPRKRTRTHLPSSSSFEIVCSCVLIVCSSSKTNTGPFTFELEHRNCCSCVFIVCNSSKRNEDPFTCEPPFTSIHLQTTTTISKLDLEGKWVFDHFRGTTIDKSTTTNDFGARARR